MIAESSVTLGVPPPLGKEALWEKGRNDMGVVPYGMEKGTEQNSYSTQAVGILIGSNRK
jgi:hypothetical protein